MKQSIAGKLGIILMAVGLAAVPAGTAIAQDKNSGFLRDYSRLQETEDQAGKTVRQWVSPKFAPDNYNAVMFDPVAFYPEPRPTEKVTAEALEQIRAYASGAFKKAMHKRFNVVNAPGPGVARIRMAFTSVAAKDEGLAAYQLIPLAFVATMASRAASGTPQRALIILETEATDSVTGQLMGLRVRVGTGERLAKIGEKDKITLEVMKPLLDELAEKAFPELEQHVKPK